MFYTYTYILKNRIPQLNKHPLEANPKVSKKVYHRPSFLTKILIKIMTIDQNVKNFLTQSNSLSLLFKRPQLDRVAAHTKKIISCVISTCRIRHRSNSHHFSVTLNIYFWIFRCWEVARTSTCVYYYISIN